MKKGAITLYVLPVIALAAAGVVVLLYNRPCANFREATLKTPNQFVSLAMADSQEKQSLGLGGCKYIPEHSGMYFPFTPSQRIVFWMKGMVIPIDIVWIKDGIIVGIERNVLHEPPATPDDTLKLYPSPGDIDAVLEIGPNKADIYGITVGSKVELTQGE